jgi:hypothetical protein
MKYQWIQSSTFKFFSRKLYLAHYSKHQEISCYAFCSRKKSFGVGTIVLATIKKPKGQNFVSHHAGAAHEIVHTSANSIHIIALDIIFIERG